MFTDDFRAWLVEANSKYCEAKKLFESTSDPPTEPYKSKYVSKELLVELLSEINNKWKDIDSSRVKTLTAFFKFYIGKICMETEECSQGNEFLSSALGEIQDIDSSPECVNLTLCILNQLGILWSGLGELPKALEHLLRAEKLHNNFKEDPDASPFSLDSIFVAEKNGVDWVEFEKNFTQTLYYLAQVYGHMNEGAKSAFYCQETLKRQKESGEYETHDWAINCATLSLYYLGEKRFQEVRHLLSCAAFVLLRYKLKMETDLIDNPEIWSQIHKTKASISVSWLKYGINVLKSSSVSDGSDKLTSQLIDDEQVRAMEKRIPCCVRNYEDARTVFIFAQDHVSIATSYYTLEDHANNHALIIQDHSALYKAFALHDQDLSRQCKLHKRRIDMLENLLGKLNPQFYLSVCRQLQFELGETYYEMLTLKCTIADETGKRVTGKVAEKINQLSTKGVSHFKGFINSLRDRNGDLPSEFCDDLVRPALIAHFYLGRFYTRVVEVGKEKTVNKMKLAEECYKFIVKYTERNPDHAKFVEEELRVIKEMLELMPKKFTQINDEE